MSDDLTQYCSTCGNWHRMDVTNACGGARSLPREEPPRFNMSPDPTTLDALTEQYLREPMTEGQGCCYGAEEWVRDFARWLAARGVQLPDRAPTQRLEAAEAVARAAHNFVIAECAVGESKRQFTALGVAIAQWLGGGGPAPAPEETPARG